ncbi:MAG TPA: rRNA maturation RNase YbeY [Thermomicrobiales bacterium]|nr:rRNA maturation RNase YbeY [Thermomicrobiales bacterium]
MSLRCDVLVDPGVTFKHGAALIDLIQFAAEREPSLPADEWHMTLRLSDDATIAALHEQFFNDPTATDVITFPAGDGDDGGEAYLGDVVVSVETAARQAGEGDHSVAREIAFLGLHGLLHLTGYNDPDDEQRVAMHRRQLQHLEAWEASRGRPW